MIKNTLLPVILASSALLSSPWAYAELLDYEGFNYPSGSNLGTLNGGIGWNGGWVNVNGSSLVNAGNLIAGSNAPTGYDARSTSNSAFVNTSNRAGRWLDCSATGNLGLHGYLDANGHVGADGKTLYVSFLQQPNGTSQFYEFEFHRGDLGDPGRIAGVGNDFNSTTVNLRTEVPAGGTSSFWVLGPGDTNVNFYVVRIDYKASNDDVYVYRNPTGNTEADNEPTLTMLSVADISFDGISLAAFLNGVSVKHDEIRLGETWGDVLGGPPLFSLQPTNQNLYVGQTTTISALAQSRLPASYQWYRGTNSMTGETNSSLTLSDLQLADANIYSVVASNALGMATSSSAILTVQPIGVSVPMKTWTVGPGSNLIIAASFGGSQPVGFQWFKDGAMVIGATNSTFAESNASFFDAGQYVLVASNMYGVVTSSVVSVSANLGGILAYDGFDYSTGTGNFSGQNGGVGWSGAWTSLGGNSANVLAENLSAGTNEPSGFDLHSAGQAAFQPSGSRSGRFLDCSTNGNFALHGYLDANGNIGADGKTLYVSFLQQPNGTSQFYEFEFHRGDLGDGGRMAGIGNDTGDHDAHLRVEAPAGGTSTFWDLGAGDTNVNFYVVRIDFEPGNDDVSVYRNPTGTNEAANVPTLANHGVGDLSFNGISFAAYLNNLTVAHDEVRVGMTWNDVIGGTMSSVRLTGHSNGQSNLEVAASPSYGYQIQAAPVVTGPWTNVIRLTTSALGTGAGDETNAWDPQRFYRAVAEPTLSTPAAPGNVIADFEGATYGDWTSAGTAFGSGPAQGTLANQMVVSGYLGTGLVNSFNGGDSAIGTLVSAQFTITDHYLNFLIGGGNHPGQTCMNLIVSNVVVATATGADSETLTAMQWDVSAYLGQTARLQIVDAATGGWGHILIDEITLSDVAFPSLSRTMLFTKNLLNLPVKNSAAMKRVTITVNGNPVRDFNIKLADGAPDSWAFVDVSAFSNQTATVSVNSLVPGSTGLNSIVQTNGIVGATNLYQETLRPQLHFTSNRGWLNDANGMFYYHGQYHLYYQHDPFNWDGSGQKWWGHAVSADMVNWQEIQEGIYSHTYGDDVWSGSAVVDAANTGGFKTGTNDVIVAAFYSTARGECIAYSNDGGLTFTDYPNDPVVVHAGTGRDPHMFWYAPSNYWVMAVYDDSGGNGVQFYTTPDFRHWTFRSKIYNGFFECPDMFQLPVDGDTNNMMWELNDASSGYQLGQFDGTTFTPGTQKLSGNSGSGYYASQTFTSMAPGGKRVVRICWAQISTPGMPFNQMMYFPTELDLRTTASGVRLCSTPIAEITNNAVNVYTWTNLSLNPGYNPLAGIRGTLFDVKAQFSVGSAQTITFTFQEVSASYNASTQVISCNGNTQSLPPINGSVQLEIVVDRDTIEIFGNNGQLYMPLPANNSSGNSLISVTSTGGTATFNSLTVSKLKSIWSKR